MQDLVSTGTILNVYQLMYLPEFEKVPKSIDFFRPGRVFTVAMRGILTATGDEDINCTHLPLEWLLLDSILDPCEREKERLSRQKKNYEDIIKLPLKAMFQYGDVQENGLVQCHLCTGDIRFPKVFWVDRHFRIYYHETFRKLHDVSSLDERKGYIRPDEMSTDRPILSASEVEELTINEYILPTWNMDPWVGAITIRRFVIVQQGTKSCLCLGIHTWDPFISKRFQFHYITLLTNIDTVIQEEDVPTNLIRSCML